MPAAARAAVRAAERAGVAPEAAAALATAVAAGGLLPVLAAGFPVVPPSKRVRSMLKNGERAAATAQATAASGVVGQATHAPAGQGTGRASSVGAVGAAAAGGSSQEQQMEEAQHPDDIDGPPPGPSPGAFYSSFRGPGMSPDELLYHVLRERVVVRRKGNKKSALTHLVALYNRLAALLPREDSEEGSSWAETTLHQHRWYDSLQDKALSSMKDRDKREAGIVDNGRRRNRYAHVISAGVVAAKAHLDMLVVAEEAGDAGAAGRAASATVAAVVDALASESLRRLPDADRLQVLLRGLQRSSTTTSAWVVYLHNSSAGTSGGSTSGSKGSNGGDERLVCLQKGRESVALVIGLDLEPVLCVHGAEVQHAPGFIRNAGVRSTSDVEALLEELGESPFARALLLSASTDCGRTGT